MAPRAEIVDTGSRWARAARITIDAPAARIFDVLADPAAPRTPDLGGTAGTRDLGSALAQAVAAG